MSRASRTIVYQAIDGERDYQDKVWGPTACGGEHEVAAFISYMEHYLTRAREWTSTLSDGAANSNGETALDFVRKVTALGVACMEQNGAVRRKS